MIGFSLIGALVVALLIALGIKWVVSNVKIHPGYEYRDDGSVKDLRDSDE